VDYVETSLMRDNSKYRRRQSSYASVDGKLDDDITVDDLLDSPRSSHQSFNDRHASRSRPETDSMSYDEYSINPTYSGVEKHKPQISGHTYEARDDLESDDRALALPKIVIIPQESIEDNVITDIGNDSPPARCTSTFAGANICRGGADSLLHSEEVPSSEIYGTVPNIRTVSSSIDSPHHKITLRNSKRNISAHRALNTVIARPSERSARACTLNEVYSSSREVSTSLQVRDEVLSSAQEKGIRHPDPEETYDTRASNEVHSKVLTLHNEVAGGKKPEETNDAVNVKAGTYYPFCNPLSDALSSFTSCIVACIQACNGDATSPEETHSSEKVLKTVDSIQADSVAIQKEALSNEERVKSKKKKIAKIFRPLRDHLRIEKRVGRRVLPRFTKSLVEKLPKNKRSRSGSKHMYSIESSEDTVETRDYASSFLAEPITDSNVEEKPIVRRAKEKSAGIVSKKFRSRSKQEPPTPSVLPDLVELHWEDIRSLGDESIKRDILIRTDSSQSVMSDLSVSTHGTQRSRTVPTRQRKRGARFAKTLNRVISRGSSSRKTPRKTKSSASKTAEFQEISLTAEEFPDDEAVELALQIGYKTKVEGASKPSQHGSSIVESEPASLLSKSQASSTSQRKGHQLDVENKCAMRWSGSTKSVSPLGTFQVTSILNNSILTPVYEESESSLNNVTTQESFIDEVQTVTLESTSSHLARETSATSHPSNESKNSALEGIKQDSFEVSLQAKDATTGREPHGGHAASNSCHQLTRYSNVFDAIVRLAGRSQDIGAMRDSGKMQLSVMRENCDEEYHSTDISDKTSDSFDSGVHRALSFKSRFLSRTSSERAKIEAPPACDNLSSSDLEETETKEMDEKCIGDTPKVCSLLSIDSNSLSFRYPSDTPTEAISGTVSSTLLAPPSVFVLNNGLRKSGLPLVPSTVAATRNTSSIPDEPRISDAFFATNHPTRFVEERNVESRTVGSESCPSFSSDGSEVVAMSPSTEAIVGGLDNTISINRSNSTERAMSLSTVDKNSIGKASIEDEPKESGLKLGLRKTISLGSNIFIRRPSNKAGMDAHSLEPELDIQFIKRSLSLPALRFINSVP
jgi:hypothetical protein